LLNALSLTIGQGYNAVICQSVFLHPVSAAQKQCILGYGYTEH